MANLIISDIDGIVADCQHRMFWKEAKIYDSFYSEENVLKDEPIDSGISFLNSLTNGDDNTLVFCTGRNEMCDNATRKWLRTHLGIGVIQYDALYMRKEDDHRPSNQVKPELVEDILRSYKARNFDFRNVYYIDDDPENVKAVCDKFAEIIGIVY